MRALLVTGLGAAALVAFAQRAHAARADNKRALPFPPAPPTPRPSPQDVIALITREAQRVGVDPRVAVAFADVESGLNPFAESDLRWALDRDGTRYRDHVLNNPELGQNPARLDPYAWHSYGLFQLLAPFHVLPQEHPRALLDPVINAQRGVRAVRRVLELSNGDLWQARRRYAGCPPEKPCDPATLHRIALRWRDALIKWRLADAVS